MRIGIDIRPGQVKYRGGGIGEYTENLVRGLAKIDRENKYLLLYQRGLPLFGLNQANFIFTPLKLPKKRMPKGFNALWDQCYFPIDLRGKRLALFHSCDFNLPLMRPGKAVVTIHDLSLFLFPRVSGNSLGDRMIYRLKMFLSSKAECIITDSSNSKEDIVKLLHIPEERIRVIPLAPSEESLLMKNEEKIKEVRRKYNIRGRFIFSLGGINNKLKNHSRLLKAFSNLIEETKMEYQLVMAGRKKGRYYDKPFSLLKKEMNELGLEGKVILTGFVPRVDLLSLYNAAELFVFPSLYEGFGIPPLEAMACGTPVVSSNTSSLPEVVGDAALLFNPYKIEEITQAMQKVLTDNDLRQNLIAKGFEQAKKFSWEKTARETLKVYEEIGQS